MMGSDSKWLFLWRLNITKQMLWHFGLWRRRALGQLLLEMLQFTLLNQLPNLVRKRQPSDHIRLVSNIEVLPILEKPTPETGVLLLHLVPPAT